MKKFILLSALVPLLYSSCVSTCSHEPLLTPEEARKELAIAKRINDKIHDELQTEGFFKIASTSKYEPEPFICDSYSTILYHHTDVEDIRNVICRVVKEYLIAYNNNTHIFGLLNDTPITTDNLHISVYFFDNDHDTLPAPYISRVECSNSQITYYKLNNDEVSEPAWTESYDNARSLTSPRAATAEPL